MLLQPHPHHRRHRVPHRYLLFFRRSRPNRLMQAPCLLSRWGPRQPPVRQSSPSSIPRPISCSTQRSRRSPLQYPQQLIHFGRLMGARSSSAMQHLRLSFDLLPTRCIPLLQLLPLQHPQQLIHFDRLMAVRSSSAMQRRRLRFDLLLTRCNRQPPVQQLQLCCIKATRAPPRAVTRSGEPAIRPLNSRLLTARAP